MAISPIDAPAAQVGTVTDPNGNVTKTVLDDEGEALSTSDSLVTTSTALRDPNDLIIEFSAAEPPLETRPGALDVVRDWIATVRSA